MPTGIYAEPISLKRTEKRKNVMCLRRNLLYRIFIRRVKAWAKAEGLVMDPVRKEFQPLTKTMKPAATAMSMKCRQAKAAPAAALPSAPSSDSGGIDPSGGNHEDGLGGGWVGGWGRCFGWAP